MGTAHWEVAGEDLAEALVKIGLDESNESSQHVLLYFRLCSEAVVDLFRCFKEICEIEHCRVAFLGAYQYCHHYNPLLYHLRCRLPADNEEKVRCCFISAAASV